MQNSIKMFDFSVFGQKYPFWNMFINEALGGF